MQRCQYSVRTVERRLLFLRSFRGIVSARTDNLAGPVKTLRVRSVMSSFSGRLTFIHNHRNAEGCDPEIRSRVDGTTDKALIFVSRASIRRYWHL